jgi:hypothetical protein
MKTRPSSDFYHGLLGPSLAAVPAWRNKQRNSPREFAGFTRIIGLILVGFQVHRVPALRANRTEDLGNGLALESVSLPIASGNVDQVSNGTAGWLN